MCRKPFSRNICLEYVKVPCKSLDQCAVFVAPLQLCPKFIFINGGCSVLNGTLNGALSEGKGQ